VVGELHSLGVAGVVAFTDSQLLTAALIGEALGLAGNPSGAVVTLTDKVAQREALRVAGLPGPRFVTVSSSTTPEELTGLLGTLEFPVVIKPRRGSGSQDTERAHDRAEAEARLAARLAVGGCPDLIVEEWLEDLGNAGGPFADYVSVEAVARGGIVVPLAVTGKFPLADPCRETGNFLPHHLGPDDARAVEALAVRAAGALGVVSGALHVEVKLTPAGPRIIEVNGRIGGGGIDALYAMVHGRSLTGIAVSVALGEPLDLDPSPGTTVPPGGFAYACFLQAPMSARSLTGLGNLEPLQRLTGVEATMVNRQVGDTLDWRDGSQGYLVSVRGVADSLEALARVPADVESRVDITWR
jgi:biotin carboxylase